ncbi:MAG: RimK family alpha-L-glutamate ligase, partial [Saprospiraceae bacterium]
SMQLLSNAKVGIPKTVFTNITQDIQPAIDEVGIPMIIKLLKGTHGLGVILSESRNNAEAVIEAFHRLKERVLLQEFIAESSGKDVRAFVVNGEVVGAMKRIAKEGEFRSNLHRGGHSIHIKLTEKEKETAIRAVNLMGLKVAGVDMLQSERGPLVLEVNPSPGLEGIESTTKVDIAGKIITFLESTYQQNRMT